MNRDKDFEILESYILGNLSKEDKKIIEDRILNDPELKKEYEYLLLLNKALLDKDDLEKRRSFIEKLSTHRDISFFSKNNHVLMMAASLLLLFGISYLIIFNNEDHNTVPENRMGSPNNKIKEFETKEDKLLELENEPYNKNDTINIYDTKK